MAERGDLYRVVFQVWSIKWPPTAYPYLATSFKVNDKKMEPYACENAGSQRLSKMRVPGFSTEDQKREGYMCWLVPLCLIQCCLGFLFLCSVLVCSYLCIKSSSLFSPAFFFSIQPPYQIQRRNLSPASRNPTHSEFKWSNSNSRMQMKAYLAVIISRSVVSRELWVVREKWWWRPIHNEHALER